MFAAFFLNLFQCGLYAFAQCGALWLFFDSRRGAGADERHENQNQVHEPIRVARIHGFSPLENRNPRAQIRFFKERNRV